MSIDPVAMNIVNRLAPGTKFSGEFECQGGILVEGSFVGSMVIKGGPLVLMPEGSITGSVTCDGDAFLAGKILAREGGEMSELNILGTALMTESLAAQANIVAGAFKSYEGAQVEGRIKTLNRKVERPARAA